MAKNAKNLKGKEKRLAHRHYMIDGGIKQIRKGTSTLKCLPFKNQLRAFRKDHNHEFRFRKHIHQPTCWNHTFNRPYFNYNAPNTDIIIGFLLPSDHEDPFNSDVKNLIPLINIEKITSKESEQQNDRRIRTLNLNNNH